MKRYRYLALAVALAAMGVTPALVANRAQAATPMDLEFQTYRSNQKAAPNGTLLFQAMANPDAEGHDIRYKLIYSE